MNRVDQGLLAEGLLILALGYSMLYALGFARLRPRDLRLVGLAYLSGWAGLGVATSLLLIIGVPSGVGTTIVIVVAAIGASAVVGRHVRDSCPSQIPHRGDAHPLGLIVAAVATTILVVDLVAAYLVSRRNRWDPFIDLETAWLPRAQIVHSLHSLEPSLWQSFITPWYPPLAPVMYGTAFDFTGGFHPAALAVQQTVLGIAFLTAMIAVLNWYVPRWITLPAIALLATTPWFWWRLESLLPDQIIAYLITAAAVLSVLWLYERRRAWLGLAVIFLAAASLTKTEGAIFGGLLAVVVVVTSIATQRRTAPWSCILLAGPALVLPWQLWLISHTVPSGTPDYNTTSLVSPGFLLERTHRLTYAITYMLRAPIAGHLGLEPRTTAIASLATLVIGATTMRQPAIGLATAAWLALSFLALASIYWTSRVELHFYVGTSASRVGTTLIVAAAVLTPQLLGLALRPRQAQQQTSTDSSDGAVRAVPGGDGDAQ